METTILKDKPVEKTRKLVVFNEKPRKKVKGEYTELYFVKRISAIIYFEEEKILDVQWTNRYITEEEYNKQVQDALDNNIPLEEIEINTEKFDFEEKNTYEPYGIFVTEIANENLEIDFIQPNNAGRSNGNNRKRN